MWGKTIVPGIAVLFALTACSSTTPPPAGAPQPTPDAAVNADQPAVSQESRQSFHAELTIQDQGLGLLALENTGKDPVTIQGWPALADMDDAQRLVLEAEIFKNTGGAASWVKCLPGWVDDLCLYRKPSPATTAAAGSAPQDLAALRAACPACDQYGWVLDDDDDRPNRRCTHPGITTGTAKEQP